MRARANMSAASVLLQEVSDARLLTLFQRYLEKKPEYKQSLKGIRLCGSKLLHAPSWQTSVAVVSNGKHSRLFGQATCHSSWACPKCTAKVMAKYGTRIACAIDALSKWYNQKCVMITFTLPHTNNMSAKDAFEVLKNTWTAFSHGGNRRGSKRKWTRKDGTETTYTCGQQAYGKMREELGIKHNVRVYEFTWGETNGWHPHIHALFWIPADKFDRIIDYEESLNELWWRTAKNQALKYYKDKEYVDRLYADYKYTPITGHKSVYISRDKNGKPRQQKSSNYIADWSGDYELTANLKTARGGHYTPRELLEKAWYDKPNRDKWLGLYAEYALTTRGAKRVHFSARSGINEIIKTWQLSNEYIELLKKKVTDKGAGEWKLVVWFTEEQWSDISLVDKTKTYLISRIIALSHRRNAKELITKLLLRYDIDISQNGEHYNRQDIEQLIFENRCAN